MTGTLKDVFRQLLRDLRAEKLRTFLTVFGIVWGTVAISLMLRPCRSLAATTASLSLRFKTIGLRCRRCISRRRAAVES